MKQESELKIPPQDRAEYRGKLKGFQKNVIDSDRAKYGEKLERFSEYIEQDREKHGKDVDKFQERIYQDRERDGKNVDKFLYSLNSKHKPKKGLSKLLVAGGMALGMGLSGLTVAGQPINFYIEPMLGIVFPVSAEGKTEQAYDPSVTIGVAGGFNIPEFGFGAKVDAHAFGSSKEYTEPVEATVKSGGFLLGANAEFHPLNLFLEQIPKLNPSILFGIGALGEFTTIEIPDFDVHEEISSAMFGLKFGIGATLFERIHAELSYTVLPASENVPGFFHFLAGYCFFFEEPIWPTE